MWLFDSSPRRDRGRARLRRRVRPELTYVDPRVLPAALVALPAAELADAVEAARLAVGRTGHVPLTELEGTYRGLQGGLYDAGRNQPPPALEAAALEAVQQVVPRDRAGRPDPRGAIGLLGVGHSVTRNEFQSFQAIAGRRSLRAPGVRLINGAQAGIAAQHWAQSERPWREALRQVSAAGLTREQVQVAWVASVHLFPAQYGPFPQHSERFAEMLGQMVATARRTFPNLALVFLSSAPYFGYMTKETHPEPYAYEGAFGVRRLILSQPAANPGVVAGGRTPVLLWGPYLWADGVVPRRDGLTWQRGDYEADGIHPTARGAGKVGRMLWSFFTTDPAARPWFTGVAT